MKKHVYLKHVRWCMGLLFLHLLPAWLHAQGRSDVTGLVRSESTGKAVPAVSVTVNNAKENFTASTVTDSTGVFVFNQLPAGAGYTFTFSSVGFQPQTLAGYTLKPGADFSFVVEMKEADVKLDEVVVVGYGTMRKKDLTGSISQIQTAKLEKENPRSVQDLLRSGATGLVVGQFITAKGGGSIEIRGTRSLTANNDPLIVVDGVIFFGELSEINPNDIEQVDVLKDASAAAIYGAKAANGVLIISTRKGKTEKPQVRAVANTAWAELGANRPVYDWQGYLKYRSDLFNSTTRFATPAKFVQPTDENLARYGITMDQWRAYDALSGDPTDIWLQRIGLFDKERANFFKGQTFDWYDHSFQTALQQNYTVSMAGKSKDNLNYYMSLGYLDNKGIVVGDKFRSYRANVKLDAKVNKWLSTGVNLNFQDRTDFGDQESPDGTPSVVTDWVGQIINNSPFARPWDSTGKLDPQPMGSSINNGTNTAYHNQFKTLQRGTSVINSILYTTVKLPFNITYTLNFSPRVSWFYNRYHESSQNPFWTDNGKVIRSNTKKFDWQIDNIINWDYTFAKVHKVKVTLLQNAEEHRQWSESVTARDFSPTDALGIGNIGAANPQKTTVSSDDNRSTGDAMMARLFYSYDNRYMLTASIRRDGYSAFGSMNPRATFPSLAFAWNFGEEKFINWDPLSAGKLRLSWGQSGNRTIGIYSALANLTPGAGRYTYVKPDGTVYELGQLYQDRMANPALKWETTSSFNIGTDLSFLNNRLNVVMDYYHMPTIDLLVEQNLPDFTGFKVVTTNIGEVLNKGFELSINTTNMLHKNFEWNTSFGFFFNRNKIKHLYNTYQDIVDANGNVIGSKEIDDLNKSWFIGHDVNAIWQYKLLGIWQEKERAEAQRYGEIPGDPKVLDVNDDGRYTNEDKVFQGSGKPQYRFTLRNDFTLFKSFDVSINMYSYWGHYQSTTEYMNNTGAGMERNNSYVRKYWTPENPSNTYARLNATNVQNISPKWVMDKSFIRLDNIAVSYALPGNIASKLSMTSCRLSASVRNIGFYAPQWEYWDPETSDPSRALPRTYSVGLNASF